MRPTSPLSTSRRARPIGRRRRGRRTVGAALVSLALPLGATGAAGQSAGAGDPDQAGSPPVAALLPDDRLTPSLAGFEVEGTAYAAAYASWTSTLRDIADAQRTVARNRTLVADLEIERITRRARLSDRRALLRGIVYDLDGLDIAMSQLAVSSYVRGGRTAEAAAMFEVGDVTDEIYAQTLERDVGNDQLRRRASLRGEIERLQGEITTLTTELGDIADRSFEAATIIEEQSVRASTLAERVPALEAAVRDARMSAFIVGTDLPLVALDAYVRAAARLASEKPSCGIQWTNIAALGRIESRHGNINGATLRADGRPTVRIIGIGLTGENGTALVPDSDDGRLDGDAELDRAVGPMQFIPTTWTIYRRDGNGDGVSDPQNMYDAALATATFLCSSGRSLNDIANLRAAYLAYNRSSSYVASAVANVERYRALAFPPPPRTG